MSKITLKVSKQPRRYFKAPKSAVTVLDRVERLLSEDTWAKGVFLKEDGDNLRMCLLGAVEVASGCEVIPSHGGEPLCFSSPAPVTDEALSYLLKVITGRTRSLELCSFNDDRRRTVDEVLDVVRQAKELAKTTGV